MVKEQPLANLGQLAGYLKDFGLIAPVTTGYVENRTC
jgi:hypothetical protein